METSAKVKEIRQCNCEQCVYTRAQTKSFSKWGSLRAGYRSQFREIIKGQDPEVYQKQLKSRDYDA